MNKEKGYIENTNVALTNKKFKKFEYLDGEESLKDNPINEFEMVKVKIDVMNFYRVLEMFKKLDIDKFRLKTNEKYLNISSEKDNIKFNINLNTLYPLEKEIICLYSVEYLMNFFKEYSIKELKEEFIYLSFSNDYPLLIEFKDDWMVLAPRIEVD